MGRGTGLPTAAYRATPFLFCIATQRRCCWLPLPCLSGVGTRACALRASILFGLFYSLSLSGGFYSISVLLLPGVGCCRTVLPHRRTGLPAVLLRWRLSVLSMPCWAIWAAFAVYLLPAARPLSGLLLELPGLPLHCRAFADHRISRSSSILPLPFSLRHSLLHRDWYLVHYLQHFTIFLPFAVQKCVGRPSGLWAWARTHRTAHGTISAAIAAISELFRRPFCSVILTYLFGLQTCQVHSLVPLPPAMLQNFESAAIVFAFCREIRHSSQTLPHIGMEWNGLQRAPGEKGIPTYHSTCSSYLLVAAVYMTPFPILFKTLFFFSLSLSRSLVVILFSIRSHSSSSRFCRRAVPALPHYALHWYMPQMPRGTSSILPSFWWCFA